MKTFKFTLFSIAMAFMVFVSCTNDESVIEDQQLTEESESITTALNQLRTQFDDDGSLDEFENPVGNVVFDFCFDFVYPLDLSFNNGSTVTVDDLDALIDVIINSTEDLYVNGIAFPFDVETYNEATNAIEIVTINNENDFINLLESCDFDTIEPCECFEVYDPVCVEVSDPNGETFIITYPNACYAECNGFTEDDFAENCEEDYNCPGGNGCFTFNFPITIITDNNETLTINSQEELDNSLYDAYYFDFVYPFTVTLEDDGEIVTINSPQGLEDLLEDCFDDNGNDECEECEDSPIEPICIEYSTPSGETIVTVFPNMCYALCAGFTQDNVVVCEDDNNPGECDECENTPVDPVCVEYTTPNGVTETITFPNACYAECAGFDSENFVDCDNNPNECSEQDIFAYLLECQWYMTTSLYNTVNAEYVQFSQDGTLEIFNEGSNDAAANGTWSLSSNPSTGEVFVFFGIDTAPHDMISQLDWTVFQCNEGRVLLESNNEFLGFERDCD
ncbi:hypothetical protein [Winogradskyella sp.]|uniref:hypothetical protein n=1 Tax=Winogradskyella sp. TaxID=1883156 RepID=UPI0025DC7100|nr:hypothetical protein [Winogradskyella sp.]